MKDFKLKLVLSILSGIIFSFIFILLAFALPVKKKVVYLKPATNKLGKISESIRDK